MGPSYIGMAIMFCLAFFVYNTLSTKVSASSSKDWLKSLMHYSLIFNLVLALMTMFTESGVEKETYEHYRKIHYDEYENSRQDDDEI